MGYYAQILKELPKTEKNPVNKMYINEINIKWKKFESLVNGKETNELTNEMILPILNEFVNAISNNKYLFNKETGNGFKEDSPVMSTSYMDDYLSILIKKIIGNSTAMEWGFQNLTNLAGFNLSCFKDFVAKPHLQKTDLPGFLMLTANLDMQFRLKGKKSFEKSELKYPLMVFSNIKVFDMREFLLFNHYAKILKNLFPGVVIFVICEGFDSSIFEPKSDVYFNYLLALRKKNLKTNTLLEYTVEAMNTLEEIIQKSFYEERKIVDNILTPKILEF